MLDVSGAGILLRALLHIYLASARSRRAEEHRDMNALSHTEQTPISVQLPHLARVSLSVELTLTECVCRVPGLLG